MAPDRAHRSARRQTRNPMITPSAFLFRTALVAACALTTAGNAHAFPRSDRSQLGVWWWTVDRWMLGVIGVLIYDQPTTRKGAWGGALLLGLILAVAAQIMAPGAAYVVVWPLLLAAIGAAATLWSIAPDQTVRRIVA
eukprot:gene58596-80241_t